MLGDYELKEICPTAMYGKPKDIVFEGITVKGPQDPDGILKIIYGDYMQLPPKESQICKHCMGIIVEK
jgi:lipopolysaccharide cholinephosphotransferase